jgi:hypothetical protein
LATADGLRSIFEIKVNELSRTQIEPSICIPRPLTMHINKYVSFVVACCWPTLPSILLAVARTWDTTATAAASTFIVLKREVSRGVAGHIQSSNWHSLKSVCDKMSPANICQPLVSHKARLNVSSLVGNAMEKLFYTPNITIYWCNACWVQFQPFYRMHTFSVYKGCGISSATLVFLVISRLIWILTASTWLHSIPCAILYSARKAKTLIVKVASRWRTYDISCLSS